MLELQPRGNPLDSLSFILVSHKEWAGLRPHLRSFEPLPDVQVGGGLVDHVHISLLGSHHCNGKALELPACTHVCLSVLWCNTWVA